MTLETNDNRFDRNTGFSNSRNIWSRVSIYTEEGAERPKTTSVTLHDCLIGGRIKFLPHDRVWVGRSKCRHAVRCATIHTRFGHTSARIRWPRRAPAGTSPSIGDACIRR